MNTNIFGIGPAELVFVAVIALIVLGPKRLPEVMRQVAGFIRQVRELGKELTSQFSEELQLMDEMNPQRIFEEATRPEEKKAASASKKPAKKTNVTSNAAKSSSAKSSSAKSSSAKSSSVKSSASQSTSTKSSVAKSTAQKKDSSENESSETSASQSSTATSATADKTDDAQETQAATELNRSSELEGVASAALPAAETASAEENSIAPPDMREAVRSEENTIAPPKVVASAKASDSSGTNGTSTAEAVQDETGSAESQSEATSTDRATPEEVGEVTENER